MNRAYNPTSLPLHSVFAIFAVTMTFAVAAFIDMLASDRGAMNAYAVRPAIVLATNV